MLDFLIVSGIKLSTIEELNLNEANAFDLSCNKNECVKTITYLKIIGIKNIDELLINTTMLFLIPRDEVADKFEKHGKEEMVRLINEDVNNSFKLFD